MHEEYYGRSRGCGDPESPRRIPGALKREEMDERQIMKGTVVSIQCCPGHRKPMRSVRQVDVMEDLGLRGDRHALSGSSRQVLLIEKETLDAVGLQPGDVGENITTAGVELMRLRLRDRLKIGGEVILEMTKPCSPCSRMEEIREGLLRELAGRRGMLSRVVRGGSISVDDPVEVIPG